MSSFADIRDINKQPSAMLQVKVEECMIYPVALVKITS